VSRRFGSRTARLAGLTLAVGLLAASAALAAQTTHQAGAAPSSGNSSRGSREHQALLELYALDSRLQASRARVNYLASEAAKLRRERRALRSELHAASATLATSQQQLALELRTLYEQGSVDPIAVVFGATSLDSGLRKLDSLRGLAAERSRIVAVTRAAKGRLLRARRTLSSHARQLKRSLASARALERSLAATSASKSAYVASLRAGTGAATTAGLLSNAQSAVDKSQQIGDGQQPPPQPPFQLRFTLTSPTLTLPR